MTSADASTSLRLAVGAAWFWYLRGHWEVAGRWLQQSLALAGALLLGIPVYYVFKRRSGHA